MASRHWPLLVTEGLQSTTRRGIGYLKAYVEPVAIDLTRPLQTTLPAITLVTDKFHTEAPSRRRVASPPRLQEQRPLFLSRRPPPAKRTAGFVNGMSTQWGGRGLSTRWSPPPRPPSVGRGQRLQFYNLIESERQVSIRPGQCLPAIRTRRYRNKAPSNASNRPSVSQAPPLSRSPRDLSPTAGLKWGDLAFIVGDHVCVEFNHY